MTEVQFYTIKEFTSEKGEWHKNLKIAYSITGKINADESNIVWICHAFTANALPETWWPGMLGDGKFFSPDNYCIICANILGSPYGSTSPLDVNSETQKPYYRDFPLFTVRDIVKTQLLLAKHLKIKSIHLIIGGSIGGFQALEWAIMEPKMIKHLILIASGSKTTAWRRAHNATQRMIIESDSGFYSDSPEGGINGMKAARAMALLSYRNAEAYEMTQTENDDDKLTSFRADSYQRYQGEKLAKRFNAYSYYALLNMLDTHDIGRKRGGETAALNKIEAKTLILAIDSDLLFTINDQKRMQENIPNSKFQLIHSKFGHDGFLLENEQISINLEAFLNSN